MRPLLRAGLLLAVLVAGAPAHALTLNGFRRAHHRMPLRASSVLMGIAYAHAADMARRGRLDHRGFRARLRVVASTAAENVAVGCRNEDCAIRMWARSPGHRRNMLMGGVSRYGIASVKDAKGRCWWVLELAN